ncbi:hypothetical protein BCR44DRAFT_1459597 [Catenaria anguillulae PL171]|uniref:Uncharacterized protein n=1 Tax=Catenaria anguillulae PL171 TaxID=765915 RepID=A0A1Y2HS64_9FUNG|nr:hypothetical protein BCR44DRAFT_1459597 [Catenaria anguillulae PL171]
MTTTITVNRHRLRLVLAAIAVLALFALMPVDSPPGGAPTIVPNAGSGAAQHQRPSLDSLSKPPTAPPSRNSTSSSSNSPTSSGGNTSSGATSIHQPDPRFNNLAMVVKSGKDVVEKRFPAQYNSFLRSIKNFILARRSPCMTWCTAL